ncbi:MAG: D-glycerate dehydrogenase [Thaumarchaeota archaeon]|nr:D-glycerate dehydrogenase [Nitrososphaerota archaeon]MCS4539309.1 D-glycerate dehydrogenase [Nitrososphaerota archaeon]
MKDFRVYVSTNEVPAQALEIVGSIAKVKVYEGKAAPPRGTLLKEVQEVDGLFCILTEKVDGELLDRAKKLKIVANMAVGYDNIDLAEATKRKVMVTNTPGVLTETVADATMALMLAVARRVVEADRYVREGGWKLRWSPMMMVGSDVYGKTLGIYGLGRIGAAVAKRATGFGMKLLYYDAVRNEGLERGYGIEYVTFDRLLRESDFLSVHVPLLPETKKSVGAREFALMKRSAYLINTARGSVVDEAALIVALKDGRIAGAGLDVFEDEPVNPKNGLLKMENVVLAPHMASGSIETRTAMAVMAARNIVAALKGEAPPDLLNKEVLNR